MLSLVLDEVADDVVHALAQQILVAQDALDRLCDAAQTRRPLPMLGFEIANRGRPDRIAYLGAFR
jgi:hypothetical protein